MIRKRRVASEARQLWISRWDRYVALRLERFEVCKVADDSYREECDALRKLLGRRAEIESWMRAELEKRFVSTRLEVEAMASEINWLRWALQDVDAMEVWTGPGHRYSRWSWLDFSSQTDSVGYARRRAEMDLERLRRLGVEAMSRVEVLGNESKLSSQYRCAFEVWAEVDSEHDVEILKRKRDLSMEDWLVACWQAGSNPGVYFPGLSADLRERTLRKAMERGIGAHAGTTRQG